NAISICHARPYGSAEAKLTIFFESTLKNVKKISNLLGILKSVGVSCLDIKLNFDAVAPGGGVIAIDSRKLSNFGARKFLILITTDDRV
ncbi:MAG: hypothetical protein J1E29_07550, partial [Duncaniella sp.]|nr:hypothetical protein [Duncaniella sp.]